MAKKARKAVKKTKKPVKKSKAAKKKAPASNPLPGMIPLYAQETKSSERMIGAIPNDKLGNKIHPKFRSAGELGNHLGDAMLDLMVILKAGKFVFKEPATFTTADQILAHYKKAAGAFMGGIKKVSKSNLSKKIKFEMGGKVIWEPTGYEVIQSWICHEIHHRAHIGAVLRVLDAKVPGMYGPTADDM